MMYYNILDSHIPYTILGFLCSVDIANGISGNYVKIFAPRPGG